jgi:hypothetical protein
MWQTYKASSRLTGSADLVGMIALGAFHLFAGATVLWADLSMENLLTGYIGTT